VTADGGGLVMAGGNDVDGVGDPVVTVPTDGVGLVELGALPAPTVVGAELAPAVAALREDPEQAASSTAAQQAATRAQRHGPAGRACVVALFSALTSGPPPVSSVRGWTSEPTSAVPVSRQASEGPIGRRLTATPWGPMMGGV
jgi:hypothetical protein